MIQSIDTITLTSAPMLPLLECSGHRKHSITKHKITLKPRQQPKARIPPSNATVTLSDINGSSIPSLEPSSTSVQLAPISQFSFDTPRPTLYMFDNSTVPSAAPMLPNLRDFTGFVPLRRLSLNPIVNKRTNQMTAIQEIEKPPVPDVIFAITHDHVYQTPKATV